MALVIGAMTSTAIFVGGSVIAVPGTVLVLVAIVGWGRRHRTGELVAPVRR